jgi:TrpR-related protein YerC/YecD
MQKADGTEDAQDDLFRAVLALETMEECRRFFLDLATPSELNALAERWHVAQLLDDGELSYREIHEQTGVSTTTITRVARFLGHEPNRGYRLVLDRLKKNRGARRGR